MVSLLPSFPALGEVKTDPSAPPFADAMEEGDSDDEAAAEPGPGPAAAEHGETPNPILFVEGLPVEVTADMLLPLFQQ